jgi:G protein-coupled receptor 107
MSPALFYSALRMRLFQQYMDVLRDNTSLCAFEEFREHLSTDDILAGDDDEFNNIPAEVSSATKGIFLSMKNRKKWKPGNATIQYTFKSDEEGLYFLIYQSCPYDPLSTVSFELDFHFMNYDAFGSPSYLTAGEMRLPFLFLFFSISYFLCLVLWYSNIREVLQGRPGHFEKTSGSRDFRIHHLMTLLLLFKFLSVLFESIRYHAIRVYGHAQMWTFLYYTFTIIRGTFMFTVILLLGTGWSIVKPYLNNREKKVIFLILTLQVVNNIAIIFISQETEGENSYIRWAATLHLVDIACCCAVLVPLVWQVNSLEKSIGEEANGEERESNTELGEKGQILSKLKLFRSFYLLVIAYIYATRILVYLFATLLDYRHIWVRFLVVELITLTFYIAAGLMFRPTIENCQAGDYGDNEGIALTRSSMLPTDV